ncbi:CBO0543 family protein [Paenibacillus psychroresistens]|uniref:CBO0543 family protein n=1 Tax=Paenibacillus psychroresistens TaxID=1778678 RepID=UPI00386639DC
MILIPKRQIKEALYVFLFVQVFTWPVGLAVVELNLIEYPVRFFPNALKSSFTLEYLVNPVICVFFIHYFPRSSKRIIRVGYYVLWTSLLTIAESIIEKYTDLIEYINFTWYYGWLVLLFVFYISDLGYIWYFNVKNNKKPQPAD